MRGIAEKGWVDGDGSDGLVEGELVSWLEVWSLVMLRDQVFRVSLSTRSPMTRLGSLIYIIQLSMETIELVHFGHNLSE